MKINYESILSDSADEGLGSSGLLNSWINAYIKKNNYNVIEKRRNRIGNCVMENEE